jgi:hypothetical protein
MKQAANEVSEDLPLFVQEVLGETPCSILHINSQKQTLTLFCIIKTLLMQNHKIAFKKT